MAISEDDKKKIDGWLQSEGRNGYGDPKDTVYAGGSPLFDERRADLKDRYEHILSRNPQLRRELNLSG
jgi:hypothetical protein